MYVDIETVPQYASYSAMPDNLRALWDKKAASISRDEAAPDELYGRAGIYAEFGRIICISIGVLVGEGDALTLHLKSFYGDDEVAILNGFSVAVQKFFTRKGAHLCGHNAKEFDFPYIARRMLINGLPIPDPLDVAGSKPWEVPFIDTLDLWKFGDHKHYTSLNLLTAILGIPTPKDDIDGSMVADVYYNSHDCRRIATYCEKDVLAVVHVMQRFKGVPILRSESVVSAK